MSNHSRDHIANVLRHAVVTGGEQALLLQQGSLRQESKGGKDFATNADIEVQKLILDLLSKALPEIPIVAEEQSAHVIPTGEFIVVDPIDGTYLYAVGDTDWGVTAAYFDEGAPKIGFIYQPARKRILQAESGKRPLLNDTEIVLSSDKSLSESIIGLEQGHWNTPEELREVNLPLSEASLCVLTSCAAIRAGLTLLSGVTTTYVNQAAKIWDFAAMALAIEEAGGLCSDLDGNALRWDGISMQAIFSANARIHQEVLSIINASPRTRRIPLSTAAESRESPRSAPAEVTPSSDTKDEWEKAFREKMAVPEPSLSPDERARRRMAFANQRTLYHRKCDGSGKKILSNYSAEETVPVFDIEYWYSDAWDQFAVGREFDFSRPFFSQYQELLQVAPRPNLQRAPQFDENSDYTNYAGKNKNCYLIFDSDKNRDCLYSYSINSCTDVMDCFRAEHCELCYECVDCNECYASAYLQNSVNCANSYFLKICIGCNNCFGCVNLKNKSYYFLNEACTKDVYEQKIAALGLDTRSNISKIRGQFAGFCKRFPERAMQGVQNENVLGDYLSNCKDAIHCFDSRRLWNCRYITQAFDEAKDCMDCTEVGDGAELLYECCYMGYVSHYNRFCSHCLGQTNNLCYCYYCPSCQYCFGCVGLHHAQYCILNKKYSKNEYETLLPKIIEHMKSTGEWGEFFPAALAPFPYNVTHAHEYYPLTKEEALARGYRWLDVAEPPLEGTPMTLPDSIGEVDEDIVSAVLTCRTSNKRYKIQRAELKLYKKLGIPLPDRCFDERHQSRIELRNGRTIYERHCAVSGVPLQTTVSPEQAKEVLSEQEFAKALL